MGNNLRRLREEQHFDAAEGALGPDGAIRVQQSPVDAAVENSPYPLAFSAGLVYSSSVIGFSSAAKSYHKTAVLASFWGNQHCLFSGRLFTAPFLLAAGAGGRGAGHL